MNTLHLVRGNCGDYYCGCGGGHVIGVYSTADLANTAKRTAQAATEAHVNNPEREHQTWQDVEVEEITLDQIPALFALIGVPTTTTAAARGGAAA